MWKQVLAFGLAAGLLAAAPSLLRGAEECGCAPLESKQWTFDRKEALTGWTPSGDVAIDKTKSRDGQQGALRVGAGGKALIKLRDKAASGKVEFWVYDDGTTPEKVKAARVGPRWGLLESDNKVLAAGILYNSYLGGDEGYTATLYDGKTWFNQLFWLGVKRHEAGVAPVDLRLRSRGGPPGLPRRQRTCRRRSRQSRSEGVYLHRRLGRPARRPRAEFMGLRHHRDAGWTGQGRDHRRQVRPLR